jgi:colicin import membrane protein
MPRKLKAYEASIGFYDLVIAVPSMKAALEAWGAGSNLFHQGMAKEADDPAAIDAAMAKPGIVLRRPIGSNKRLSESADLPDDLAEARPRAQKAKPAAKKRSHGNDDAASRRAAVAYQKQQKKDEAARKESAAAEAKVRERRQTAIASAQSELDDAEREHKDVLNALAAERTAISERIDDEEARWTKLRMKFDADLKRAKSQ